MALTPKLTKLGEDELKKRQAATSAALSSKGGGSAGTSAAGISLPTVIKAVSQQGDAATSASAAAVTPANAAATVTPASAAATGGSLLSSLGGASLALGAKPAYGTGRTLTTASPALAKAQRAAAVRENLSSLRSVPWESAAKATGSLLNSVPDLAGTEEQRFDAALQGANAAQLEALRDGLADKLAGLSAQSGAYAATAEKGRAVTQALNTRRDEEYYSGLSARQAELERVSENGDFQTVVEQAKSGLVKPGNLLTGNADARNIVRDIQLLIRQERGETVIDEIGEEAGHLTDSQRDTLLYYAGTNQWDKAGEYLDSIQRELNAAKAKAQTERAAAYAQEHPVMGAAGNIAASFATPAAWLGNLIQTAKNTVTGTYEPTDTNTSLFEGARLSQATREGVSKAAEIGVDIAGKDIGSFLAETGLSIGQFLSKVPLGPLALGYMGAGAAGETTYEALEGGAAPGQALALGTAAGLIEAATEKIGLDSLMDLAARGSKSALVGVLKQMGAEAGEETVSEVANTLVNLAVLGEDSDFKQYVASLVQSGMSREEAEAQALKQFFLVNTAWAAAGGALSGGVTGTGASISNAITGRTGQASDGVSAPEAAGQEGIDWDVELNRWDLTQPVMVKGQNKAAADAGAGIYTAEEAEAIRHEGRTFRNLVAGFDSTVSEFFSKWASGRKSHQGEKLEKLYLGKMSEEVQQEVSDILGYEVTDRDFIVTNDDVKHIMDEHGNPAAEIKKGNLPLEQWVFDALPSVLANPDTITAGHEGAGKNAGKTGVVFTRAMPDGRIVSIQFDNPGRGTMEVTTVYAKESTFSVVTAPERADTRTPKVTEPIVLSSTPTVSQKDIAVKSWEQMDGVDRLLELTRPEREKTVDWDMELDRWDLSKDVGTEQTGRRLGVDADGKMVYNIGQMKEEAHPKIKGSRAKSGDGPRGFASSAVSISNSDGDVNIGSMQKRSLPRTQSASLGSSAIRGAHGAQVGETSDSRTLPPEKSGTREGASSEDSISNSEQKSNPQTGGRQYSLSEGEKGLVEAVENAAEVQQPAAQAQQPAAMTPEEVMKIYPKLKEARRAYEKARARNSLTEEENKTELHLMRGDLELSDLREERENVQGITEVYRAREEYESYARQIRRWNQARKQALRDQADGYLSTAMTWKDKARGILYSRETMARNIRDIVPDQKLAEAIIREYFTPVQRASAEAARMKNDYRDRVRDMNISRKVEKGNQVSEAYAVQLLGEAEDSIRMLRQSRGRMKVRDGRNLQEWEGVIADLWKQNPGLDQKKIRAGVEGFRQIYDGLFTRMNEARVRNGYEPVNYRSGYFPHFQSKDGDGLLGQFGKAMGISTEVTALPTTINGMTHTFKPGIRWFGNAMERKGFETSYDAVEGFDRYIEGVADVICQTDNIQKLRALSGQIRYRSGDEGIRKQIDAIRKREDLNDEEKAALERDVKEKGRFTLGNLVVELEEYTNLLANKKSRHDRDMEQAMGRDAYNVVKKLESRVAANMVAVNPGSWLTNLIPLTQGWAGLETGNLLRGMWDTMGAIREDDGVTDRSVFLTNRKGSDPIVRTWSEGASAAASRPMEYIDQFTAGSLVRARYRQNLGRGLSEAAAMEEADSWAAGVMADRSKGATPTLFNRSDPVTKLVTQFQLEVNNQLSYLFKDIPRDTKEKGLAALAAALLKFAIGAFLYDELYEKLIGRRPALDPIGILNDTVGDLTGYELPNLVDLASGAVTGDMPSFRVEQTGLDEAAKNTGSALLEQLPFTTALNIFGTDLNGGRVAVASAFPDLTNLNKGTWIKELSKPLTYLVPSFGGGQVKKIVEGVTAVAQGGSYTKDKEGNEKLQYPVYSDSPGETVGNLLRATVFGKSSLPTAQDWVESGFKTWGTEYTQAYQNMREAGMGEREAYDILSAMKAEEEKAAKLGIVARQALPDELTQMLAGVVMGTELETDEGNRTAYAKLLDAEEELGLTSAEYLAFYEEYGGQTMGSDKLREAYGLGVGVEDYLKYYDTKKDYDADESGGYSTGELIASIEGSGMTGDARTAMYMLTFPKWVENAEKYDVGFGTYVDFKLATEGLEGDKDKNGKTISGSLKGKVLAAIDGLKISGREKDKLYLAAGYAESGLEDAPWN